MAGLLMLIAGMSVAAEPAAKPIKSAFIPAEASWIFVAHPKMVFELPATEMAPSEVVSAAGIKELGFDPTQLEELVAFGTLPGKNGDPSFGAVARFSEPPTLASLKAKLLKDAKETTRDDGNVAFQLAGPNAPSLVVIDSKTLVIGMPGFLEKMLAVRTADKKVVALLAQFDEETQLGLIVGFDAMRDDLTKLLQGAPPLPGPLEELKKLPSLLAWSKLEFDLEESLKVSLVSEAHDEPSAKSAEKILRDGLAFGKQMALSSMAQNAGSIDPVEQAGIRYGKRLADLIFKQLDPKRDAEQVSIEVDTHSSVATVGVMSALLLPAIQSARQAAARASGQ